MPENTFIMKSYTIVNTANTEELGKVLNEGMSPFEMMALMGEGASGDTPVRVFRRKIGQLAYPSPGMGEFEAVMPEMFTSRTGKPAVSCPLNKRFVAVDSTKPWLRISPGALWWEPSVAPEDRRPENAGVLLCFTTSQVVSGDEYPARWLFAANYQMRVLGLDKAYLAWICFSGGLSFHVAEISFDAERWAKAEEIADSFWRDHVLRDVAPGMAQTNEDAMFLWGKGTEGKDVLADGYMLQLCARMSRLKEKEKEVKKEMDALSLDVRKYMQDGEKLVDASGGVLATWKNVISAGQFQMERFREEHSQLYEMYRSPDTMSRRLIFKMNKGKGAA